MKKSNRGFTLIELLVVISVIGLLSGVVMVSMQDARAKARDSRRLSDMRQIVSALTMYYDKYGAFPPISPDACCDGWDQAPCVAEPSSSFIGGLQTRGITGTVPSDPGGKPAALADNACYGYAYYVYSAGTSGCDTARGRFFVLGVRNMETSTGAHPNSPGFRCPSRNWQSEFEWVTGVFEQDL